MDNTNKGFNVLDMIDDYASTNDVDTESIFGKPNNETEDTIPETHEDNEAITEKAPDNSSNKPVKANKPKKGWTPDESILENMPELHRSGGAVYNKDEVILKEDTTLHNIADDNAIQESRETMDELSRKNANIEDAKRRHGITKLNIPPGEWQVRILTAANDTNYKRGQEILDEIFNEIEEHFPEFILEKIDNKTHAQIDQVPTTEEHANVKAPEVDTINEAKQPEFHKQDTPIINVPENVRENMPSVRAAEDTIQNSENHNKVKVDIDKRNLDQVSWSEDEVAKIKKSRIIELNIVEGKDIDFGNVVNVVDNAVDNILAQYKRSTNDKLAALPASKYRATFSGLTYPEVLDLSTSVEMNNLDGERKKWSICFAHIHNQSIGEWKEYYIYTDENGKTITTDDKTKIPDTIPETSIHFVSRYEDFLRKTSYMDLEFMLWKILCATTMDKEIISIECHSTVNDKRCGNTYDWIYDPNDLLDVNSINPGILADMEDVINANSTERIMELFNTSPVNSKDYVTLPKSQFRVIYGHISAYEYLDSLYSKIQELSDQEVSPTTLSKSLMYMVLTSVKAFLVPQRDGSFVKIIGVNNLIKVLDILDEVDWTTLNEVSSMMLNPYAYKFILKDCTCPKCHSRSSINIDSMSRLLFIIARSLNSVSVTLKRT